ncbi:uncharacterized protein [Aristolochia californica]|uniref:uncharacterized protein n=1 Tax=Aristolochia californica TaxID=171875 RepID=UPI0035D9F808
MDGSATRLKAHLVAKGYTHCYGVDYEETFFPVAKLNSVCILLSLATNSSWLVYQLDVKNIFLNSDICKKIYMIQLPSYVVEGESRKYVLDLLEEMGIMMGCCPTDTPMDANIILCVSSGEDIDIGKYERLVGKFIYLTVTTLDISYDVSVGTWLHGEARSKIWLRDLVQKHNTGLWLTQTKHIEVDCHFIQEKFQAGIISLKLVSSQEQVADIFTKPVTFKILSFICGKLSIYNVFSLPA